MSTFGSYVEETVECYLCGKQNSQTAVECKDCNGPMHVSSTYDTNPERPPKIIATLGAPGVGKSVYLGMLLDSLAREKKTDVTLEGADASQMQHRVVSALTRGAFPDNNEEDEWRWPKCQHGRGRKANEIFLPDFPALPAMEDYEQRRAWPVIPQTFSKSVGLMLFLDAAAVQRGDADEEFFALHLLRYYTDIFRRPLDVTDSPRKRKARIAIVMTKADQCQDCHEDPDEFVRGQMPELWKACETQLKHYKFFATSVAGVCVTIDSHRGYKADIPLRIEPRGIQAPFRWMLSQI